MNRDEIHRMLGAAETAPRSAAGPWRDTLLRRFGRGDGAPEPGTAAAGGPERRQFLRLGGTAVLGAAVLAACGSDEEAPPSETGVTEPAPTETTFGPPQTTTPEAGAANDLVVARTAVSLELVAVAVYDAVLGTTVEGAAPEMALPGAIRLDGAVVDAATRFRDHHRTDAQVLSDLVREMGGDPVTQPNAAIVEGVVLPELADLTSQRAVLMFAHSVEDIAASTYGWAASVLSSAEHRQAIMGIGGASARHSAAAALLLDPSGADAAPRPFLDVSGPARIPDTMFVQDGQDGGDVTAEAAPEGDDGTPTEGSGGESDAGSEGGEGEGGSGGEGNVDEGEAGGDSQDSGDAGSGSEGEGGTGGGTESSGSGTESGR